MLCPRDLGIRKETPWEDTQNELLSQWLKKLGPVAYISCLVSLGGLRGSWRAYSGVEYSTIKGKTILPNCTCETLHRWSAGLSHISDVSLAKASLNHSISECFLSRKILASVSMTDNTEQLTTQPPDGKLFYSPGTEAIILNCTEQDVSQATMVEPNWESKERNLLLLDKMLLSYCFLSVPLYAHNPRGA